MPNQGKFLLLIVGDRIYPEVAMLLEAIQSAPNLDFKMGLVEILMYRPDSEKSWPLLIIPRVVGKTKEVTRAVVKIFYEERKPDVDVVAVQEGETKTKLNFTLFEQSMPEEYAQIFIPVLEKWIHDDFHINWGSTGIGIYYWRSGWRSIVDIYPTDFCLLTEKMVKTKDLPLEPYHKYRQAIDNIPVVRRLFTQEKRYLKYTRDIPLDEFHILVDATDRLVRELNAYKEW